MYCDILYILKCHDVEMYLQCIQGVEAIIVIEPCLLFAKEGRKDNSQK